MKLPFLALLLASFSLFSQNITGVLKHENEPVLFANILLFSASDSSFVKAALSDTTGYFEMDQINPDATYYIQTQIMGLKDFYSENFKGAKNFGTIALQTSSTEIETVNISVQKQLIEKTGRGLVMNVEASPVVSSGTTEEAIEKIPGVVLNQDGTLSLKGKSDVLIYMDGKRTYMSVKDLMDLLKNTPASDIEKIEVFETPPAKFDAEGNAGIINIVRKKGTGLGTKGALNLGIGYGNYHKFNPSAYINKRTKNYNIFGSVWYHNNMFDFKTTSNSRINNQDSISQFFNQAHRIHHSIGGGARGGIDYYLNKKTTLGYVSLYYQGQTFGLEPSNITITGAEAVNNDFVDASQLFSYGWSGQTHNVNLKHNLKDNGYINADINFILRANTGDNETSNSFLKNNTQFNSNYFQQLSATDISILMGKVDYAKEIWKQWNMETGLKLSIVSTNNNFKAFEGKNKTTATENLGLSNEFKYDENINAGYVSVTKIIKEQINLDFGVRLENTRIQGTSKTNDSTFTRNYTRVFPNAAISYNKKDKYSISGSYTKRIQRPNYSQLNPFSTQVNQFNYFTGNPFLNPQITDVGNLTLGLKNKVFITLSAAQTLGLMTRVIDLDQQTQTNYATIRNLNDFYNYSASINFPLKYKRWYTINVNATAFRNILKSDLDIGKFEYTLNSFNINLQQNISLPKGYKVELSGYYNHDSYWNIFFVDPYYQIDFGVSKSYKQWNFNFVLRDFLNIREGNGGVFQNDVYMPTTYKPESRIARLRISYKFGDNSVKEERKRKTGTEDILDRT